MIFKIKLNLLLSESLSFFFNNLLKISFLFFKSSDLYLIIDL